MTGRGPGGSYIPDSQRLPLNHSLSKWDGDINFFFYDLRIFSSRKKFDRIGSIWQNDDLVSVIIIIIIIAVKPSI